METFVKKLLEEVSTLDDQQRYSYFSGHGIDLVLSYSKREDWKRLLLAILWDKKLNNRLNSTGIELLVDFSTLDEHGSMTGGNVPQEKDLKGLDWLIDASRHLISENENEPNMHQDDDEKSLFQFLNLQLNLIKILMIEGKRGEEEAALKRKLPAKAA